MAKTKGKKKAQDFAPPYSILIFNDDMMGLDKISAKVGVPKATLIRLAVRDSLKRKIFDGLAAS